MIDLHCHLLPGIDDGPGDIDTSLDMARMAVADGIQIAACTPHVTPGVYDNRGPEIKAAVAGLAARLKAAGIPLHLVAGADAHLAPDLLPRLDSGEVPTLSGSRYFLLEPPHHVPPPRLDETIFRLMAGGYVPILTHPERLSWIQSHYSLIERLVQAGVWMQITAGSLTGRFGKRAWHWSVKLLDAGMVHIVCSDAHGVDRRPPLLSEARTFVAERLGEDEARRVFLTRPLGILKNLAPSSMMSPSAPSERASA